MTSYGRNFHFRVPPRGGDREARFVLGGATDLPIGVPVLANGTVSTDFPGAETVALATGAQAPTLGRSGIAVYEHAPAAFAGHDPFLDTYSDIDTIPVGKLLQVVHGTYVKVALTNTDARTFLNTRDYAARTMVAGVGIATPTVEVGDWLTPGTGNDTAGYWAETSNASEAWLVVTAFDNARQEVECRVLF
jgi:hypothetical protein